MEPPACLRGERRPPRPHVPQGTDSIAEDRPPPLGPVAPLRPLDQTVVAHLQRMVGNTATTLTVQRYGPIKYPPAKRPKKGMDVRSELRATLPGLLAALTQSQLDHWQKLVDYYAITRYIDGELREQKDKYFEGRPALEAQWQGAGEFVAMRNRLLAQKPEYPQGGEKVSVDPKLLLADDVFAEPDWDKNAQRAWREWAVAELQKEPVVFDMFPEHDDEIISRRTSLGTYSTRGVITLQDLKSRFGREYAEQVTGRADWARLRGAYEETKASFAEATQLHKERSDINARNRGVLGVDIVRNIIEFFGEGDENYPAMSQWDEPKKLLSQVGPLLDAHQFELVVPLLAMAELSTAKAADRIFAYDNRVESGARLCVKWLGRVKTVGSIAASVAAGPLGITGSALVAGGYTFVQEGAQNAMAVALGQRTDLGLADLVKQAGVSTMMGLMGGALQTRFQTAIAGRLAQMTGTAGGAVRNVAVSAAAAGTSAVYTAAAETVLNAILNGQALPKDATEMADMIVDSALKNVAMDVALHGPSARVAQEYQAWRTGKAKPVVPGMEGGSAPPGGKDPTTAPTADPAAAKDPAAQPHDTAEPRHMPEDVVRRMLHESGGWERLNNELRSGTGLGHGLMPAERQSMLNRFQATRELLAKDVANMFGGSVLIADTGAGTHIEVRFLGDGGPERLAQAKDFLDTKHPGWDKETGVALTESPKAADTAASKDLWTALEKATPEARLQAARLAPLYKEWRGQSAMKRLEMLLEIVNADLRSFGVPEVFPAIGKKSDAGEMNPKTWELSVRRDLLSGDYQTPDQFAKVCGTVLHEGRHALQMFRAARADLALARNVMHKDVWKAAAEAQVGNRKAEAFEKTSLAYQEGAAAGQSMWGKAKPYRDQVYARLDAAQSQLKAEITRLKEARKLPPDDAKRKAAERDYEWARIEHDQAHDDYMRLPEEVEAWRVGKEAEAAVRERVRLIQRIDTTRTQEIAANVKYLKARQAYTDALFNPDADLPPGVEWALRQAEREHTQLDTALRGLIDRLDALTSGAKAP
jgi:hypothetical protein